MTQFEIDSIADLYRNGSHDPYNASWSAFIRDTKTQFDALVSSGWRFSLSDTEPYPDSASMFEDIATRNLRVFTGGSLVPDHPLNHSIGVWTLNLMFRAVHDVLGHGPNKAPFETFDGEVDAYRNHALRYSSEAIPALYSETVGQLCHYYAGHGFVEQQKAVILPVVYI